MVDNSSQQFSMAGFRVFRISCWLFSTLFFISCNSCLRSQMSFRSSSHSLSAFRTMASTRLLWLRALVAGRGEDSDPPMVYYINNYYWERGYWGLNKEGGYWDIGILINRGMDCIGICTICQVSRDQFIPLVCGHTVCPECCREEQMRGDYLVCSRCEEVTLLEVETLERIRQVHLNPETSMRYGRGQELEVAFLHCIEGIEKSFKYLHEQLNLKAQALIHNITQVYEAEVQKMRVMSRTLKDSRDSSTSNPFPQSSSKLLRMLKGNQYSLDITPLQTNIMQLTFNLSNGPYLHKYPRCSHQSKREEKEKREKSTQFMKDKSYTRIMGILNKSRSTLDTNLKNIKRSIHFRSTEGPKLDAVNRKSDDSFD